MAPQEVAGLQALAKAHGGSLTVNPDTGLAEAGFLSSVLPMVIGAGLSIASGGALTPLMAAGITGAGYGVATGSLKKGLMAGLGAYGGAGLAGGLTAAGATAALPETGLTAAGGVAGANPMVAQPMTFGAGPDATSFFGSGAAPASSIPSTYATNPEAFATNAYSAGPSTANLTAGAPQVATTTPISDRFSQATQGFKNLGTPEGRDLFMGNAASKGVEARGVGGGMGLTKYGLAGLAPMMFQDPEPMAPRPTDKPYEYSFDYGRAEDPSAGYTGAYTGERTYFNPVYTRTAAGGGLMDIGPVEAMSDRNQAETMMANGGMRFAEGGEAKAARPVEEDPYYTMSGQSGDAFKYLMGQMPAPSRAPAPAAAPAPVQATVRPVATQPEGVMGKFLGAMTGSSGSDATMRPYTFDPVTGTFTAMPISNGADVDVGGVPQVYSNPNITPWDMGGTGMANGGIASLAQGGPSHLGDYSDGGRLLKGPGDGVSDSIPASIGDKRPARLADGEFVVPARIVSELGNGSTEAGARKLYAMMDRVQNARKKSIGKDRVAVNSRSEKLLPA
jgi:hypothetical protein